MNSTVNMPVGFANAFNLVCEFYRCTPEEIELMRAAARANPQDAATCYFALQKEIERRRVIENDEIAVSAADMVIEPKKEGLDSERGEV